MPGMMLAVRADLQQLDGAGFDLCVLGGSVFGAAVAWLAASAGAKVALVAGGDLGATPVPRTQGWLGEALSWQSVGDAAHAAAALRERDELLRGAPHLCRAVPCEVAVADRAAAGALVRSLRRWREGTLPAATVAAASQRMAGAPALVAAFDGVRDEPALARAAAAAARACGAAVLPHGDLVGLGASGLTVRDAVAAAAAPSTVTLRAQSILVADDEQPDRLLATLKLAALAAPRVQCGAWSVAEEGATPARGWVGAVDGGIVASLPGHERRVLAVVGVDPGGDPAAVLPAAARHLGVPLAAAPRSWRRVVPSAWRREPTIAGDVHLWPWRPCAPLTAARAYVAATLRPAAADIAALGAGVVEPLAPWWRRHGARGVAWRERHVAPASPLCPHRPTEAAAIAFAVGDDEAVGFVDVLRRIDPDGSPCLREACLRQAHAVFVRARRWPVDDEAAAAVTAAVRAFGG